MWSDGLDVKHDYTLSEEFQRNHYLVGLLLFEVKSALNEIQDVRRCAIRVLRNLLAKHSLDDRYTSKVNLKFSWLDSSNKAE